MGPLGGHAPIVYMSEKRAAEVKRCNAEMERRYRKALKMMLEEERAEIGRS